MAKSYRTYVIIVAILLTVGCTSVQITREQVEGIRNAAAKVLPPEAKVEVTTKSRFLAKPELVISAHLLEGHSPDEKSPYVQGDYGTHEKLTRLVRYRCAKIFKSVATESQIPDVSKIIIQARHGVRQTYIGALSGSTDVATTIYQISISVADIKKQNWLFIGEEEIMKLWKVDENIIPSLQLQIVTF